MIKSQFMLWLSNIGNPFILTKEKKHCKPLSELKKRIKKGSLKILKWSLLLDILSGHIIISLSQSIWLTVVRKSWEEILSSQNANINNHKRRSKAVTTEKNESRQRLEYSKYGAKMKTSAPSHSW